MGAILPGKEDLMGKIHIIDVTNRDGVQTAKLGLSKLEKTMVNIYAMGELKYAATSRLKIV